MTAHIGSDNVEAIAELPGEGVKRLGAAGISVNAHDRRSIARAPIEIMQAQIVEGQEFVSWL